MIDVAGLKASADILAVVESDLGPPHGHAGRWHSWPCPFHPDWPDDGGSLKVTPNTGTYFCFGCGATGDVISWMMKRNGLDFYAACETLGAPTGAGRAKVISSRMKGQASGASASNRQPSPRATVGNDDPPSADWQHAAGAFIAEAEQRLWRPIGERALAYLREKRHLDDSTIKARRLGFWDQDMWRDPSRWGLDGGKDVWLPRGIVIPGVVDGVYWYVKVRRPLPGDELADYIGAVDRLLGVKYGQPRGGKVALFGADTLANRDIAVWTEGEFDAMLLGQETNDLVGVVTMGSASLKDVPLRWLWLLRGARRILACFDTDEAGGNGAANLAALSGRVRVVKPFGKDLTEMKRAGGDLRAWVKHQIERHMPSPSPSVESRAEIVPPQPEPGAPEAPTDTFDWAATGRDAEEHLRTLTADPEAVMRATATILPPGALAVICSHCFCQIRQPGLTIHVECATHRRNFGRAPKSKAYTPPPDDLWGDDRHEGETPAMEAA